jgi:Mg/Co/Ni transporter MgtE
MTIATLADLRQSSSFFKTNEVVQIVNGRKKEQIGYFVPIALKDTFEKFLIKLKREQRRKLLKRVALTSKKDIVGDGAVDDGIK